MVSHGLSTILYCKRSAKEKHGWKRKSEVKLCAGNAFIHRKQTRHGCPAWGCTAVWTWPLQLGYYPFVSPKTAEWQQLSFLPFPARVRPVKYRWNELGYLCNCLSYLVLQNPYILLTGSGTSEAHCNTWKPAQGKPMVIFWTSTLCTERNTCLSTHAACKQHLARQDT